MPEVHPAIAKKIEELFGRAREMASSQQQNLDILLKTIDLRDSYGLKMRVAELVDCADKMRWLAAQVDLLKSLPYDMAAEEMAPKRKVSTQMAAVTVPEKKDG
jgi:hypothetical protein